MCINAINAAKNTDQMIMAYLTKLFLEMNFMNGKNMTFVIDVSGITEMYF